MAETAPVPQAPAAESTQTTRPTRPDENVFKEALAKAEKAHKASMDKLVRSDIKLPAAHTCLPRSSPDLHLDISLHH